MFFVDNVVVKYGKAMRSVTKILGSAFNEMTKSRRGPYEAGMTEWKNTRQIVKRLSPSDEFLFGGKLAEVAKNLKDSAQVRIFSSYLDIYFFVLVKPTVFYTQVRPWQRQGIMA